MTPRNFAFPNLIPGRHRLPADFQLWPDFTDARGLPATPPIPDTVVTGDVITASHENTVSTAIADLWQNDQWLASQLLADPTTTKGDLITRDTSALVRLPVGAAGSVLVADAAQPTGLKWAALSAASVGAVPTTRQVLAGAGLSGGGALSADVTLAVVDDASVQKHRFSKDGAFIAARRELNVATGANVTLTMADDIANNRVNLTIAAAAGGAGGMTDPTTTFGDLIVRGTSAPVRLGVGANGLILTADSTAPSGVKWGAAGAGSQTPWLSDINAASFALANVKNIGIGAGTLASVGVLVMGTGIFDAVLQQNTGTNGYAGISLQNDLGHTANFRIMGSARTPADIARIELAGVPLAFSFDAVEKARITAAGSLGIGTPNPAYPLDVAGDVNITGTYRVNGTPIGTGGGGSQTPWLSDIAAAGFNLNDVGRVGIGVAVPQVRLHVKQGSAAFAPFSSTVLFVENAGTSAYIETACAAATDACGYLFSSGSSLTSYITDHYNTWNFVSPTRPAQFSIGGAERMRITTAGNVGIGTPTPSDKLTVQAAGTDNYVAHFCTDDGTPANQKVARISLGIAPNAKLASIAGAQTFSGDYAAGELLFLTSSSSVLTERMRISSTGNVGINVNNPQHLLHIISSASITTPAEATQIGIGEGSVNPAYRMTMGYFYDSGAAPGWKGALQATNNGPAASYLLLQPQGGSVGIGTIAPVARLHVAGTSADPSLSADTEAVYFAYSSSIGLAFGSYLTAPFAAWIQTKRTTNNGIADPLVINPLGGAVGIGTTSPSCCLNVVQDANIIGGGMSFSQLTITGKTTPTKNLWIGFDTTGNQGVIQAGNAGISWNNLLLNPIGGNIGIGTTNPLHQVQLTPAATPTGITLLNQFAITEAGMNPDYRLTLGYGIESGAYKGAIQATQAGPAAGMLLLQPQGGKVGIGEMAPAEVLSINGALRLSGVTAGSRANSMCLDFTTATARLLAYGPNASTRAAFQVLHLYSNGAGALQSLIIDAGGRVGLSVSPSHAFEVWTDDAAKPGTTTWTVTSDGRTKRNVRPYTEGLETLLRLQPTAYEYNGEANTPDGMEAVGFVAQDVADIIPACVRRSRGTIAGDETDVLGLQLHDVTFMLLNALREIDERLRRMERTN